MPKTWSKQLDSSVESSVYQHPISNVKPKFPSEEQKDLCFSQCQHTDKQDLPKHCTMICERLFYQITKIWYSKQEIIPDTSNDSTLKQNEGQSLCFSAEMERFQIKGKFGGPESNRMNML